ncbi:hypothetical protein T5B8_11726 [Salinisphaera sp. T5B8]
MRRRAAPHCGIDDGLIRADTAYPTGRHVDVAIQTAAGEALHNLSRIAFESSQTVRQGVQAQRLPQEINEGQVKPGNAAAASVRPNPAGAAGFARAWSASRHNAPCNPHATPTAACQPRAKHTGATVTGYAELP